MKIEELESTIPPKQPALPFPGQKALPPARYPRITIRGIEYADDGDHAGYCPWPYGECACLIPRDTVLDIESLMD